MNETADSPRPDRADARLLIRLEDWDARLVAAARGVKILSRLTWPSEIQSQFLHGASRGNPRLPAVEYPDLDLSETRAELGRIVRACRADHPIAAYLRATAKSYRTACRLLECAGTARMTAHSAALYGSPGGSLSGGRVTNLDAARHFLRIDREFHRQSDYGEGEYCLTADWLKQTMEPQLAEVFGPGTVRVVIDPELASKAAAGATRIRLRSGTCFSEYDVDQLLQHEAFVHSLTAINGRRQSRFQSLGLGAPRTTQAQEGLATFAELITGSIDVLRLERVALRVIAIGQALDGADFIDVFRFFMSAGQSEIESFNSAMRVFRGAPLTGGSAFTKDVVYLHGLMEVHTFFRWAMIHQRLYLCRYFFAGRMAIDDVLALVPMFEAGVLDPPQLLPPWMTRSKGLAGYLAFSVFANRIHIDGLHQGHRFDSVKEMTEA